MIRNQKFYTVLHDVADRAQRSVARSFVDAITSVRDRVRVKDIVEALNNGGAAAVMALLDPEKLSNELGPVMQRLQQVYVETANASAEVLKPVISKRVHTTISPDLSFNLVNPESVQFLQDYRAGLIAVDGALVGATSDGILAIIEQAFAEGLTVQQQARRIRDLIGLTEKQSQAFANLRATLRADNVPAAAVNRQTQRYYNQLLRQRATNIARTETLRAANAGQQQLWIQATNEGLLDKNETKRVWITTPDDRLCQICEPIPGLNSGGVGMNEGFETPIGLIDNPPAHPQCRCTTALEIA